MERKKEGGVEQKHENIPCLHETGAEKDSSKTVADHYPLSKEEIGALLDKASQSKDVSYISSIQVRLVQGIKGMVCPKLIEGDVFERANQLNKLFVKEHRRGSKSDLVDKFYGLMNG